jgi:hypothetical protein
MELVQDDHQLLQFRHLGMVPDPERDSIYLPHSPLRVKQLQILKIMQYFSGMYVGISTEKIVFRQS